MTNKIPLKQSDIYVIKNPQGLYSKGGAGEPTWKKTPKTWTLGPLKNHLHLYCMATYRFVSSYNPVVKEHFKGSKYLVTAGSVYGFPYKGCKILKIDPSTLDILESYDAEEFAWNEVYKTFYEKDKRYIDKIKECAKKWRKKW